MTSVHAEHVVAQIESFETLAEAVADLQWVVGTCGLQRDKRLPLLSPSELTAAVPKRSVHRLGLIFGNEADGLSNEELAACDAYVRIPAAQRQPSLNLSHAVAVLLSRLYAEGDGLVGEVPEHRQDRAASRGELETLRERWTSLMDQRGYLTGGNEARLPASLDRMFRRFGMLRTDVRTLMGMLRHLSEDE